MEDASAARRGNLLIKTLIKGALQLVSEIGIKIIVQNLYVIYCNLKIIFK